MGDWYPDSYIHSLQNENFNLRKELNRLQSELNEIKCANVNVNFAWYGGNP